MTDKLYEIIRRYEQNGDFTHAVVTEDMLKESESRLGAKLPEEYKQFLKTFGHGGIGGIEVLGIGKNGTMLFETETIKYRDYGMPNNLLIIENCDEWVYCIDVNNGKVVMWSGGCASYSNAYNCFNEFLQDRVNDILENM